MSLRTLDITDSQFKQQAAKIKDAIINITNRQARHPAIQKVQDIFRQKAQRLYHWAEDRNIPADNNRAERELRPLVIARKISFGSQSDAGARTREILMTVLHTLKKKTGDVTAAFKSALDKFAKQNDVDIYKAVFSLDSS
jgi:glutamyl-tRNA reductase